MLVTMTISAYPQQMSKTMSKYADGCFALREAIAQKDFGKLLSAKDKFYGIKLEQFSTEDFTPVDSVSQSVIKKPTILFTPDFADELIQKGDITLEDINNAVIMRKGDGEIYLWHASITPGSSVSFNTEGSNDCEMFLCSTSDSNLNLSINSVSVGKLVGKSINDNSAWYINWNLPDAGEPFTFTITNNGNNVATFVIAIN